MKLRFCGAIEGVVTRRPGESDSEAVTRAERVIQAALDRSCKRLGYVENSGPLVGLDHGDIRVED